MPFLSYTIFADINCTIVRYVANLSGESAVQMLRTMHSVSGKYPEEGHIIAGCRLDRIESETQAEAA